MYTSAMPSAADTNNIRQRWAAGEVALGSWVTLPAIAAPRALAAGGYDFVIIEQQHAFVSQSQVLPLLQAAELGGTTPLVRVGEDDLIGIARALDLGARGVVAPMVSTPEQARAVASAVRFPPMGDRSWGGLTHHATTAEANEDLLCFVMIESPEGVANADEILATPGIDGAFIGPSDLTLRMEIEPDPNTENAELHVTEQVVLDAMKTVLDACKRHGKHAGMITIREDEAQAAVDLGATFLLYQGDISYIQDGARKDVAKLRLLNRAGS